jgi:hypothetical protein
MPANAPLGALPGWRQVYADAYAGAYVRKRDDTKK